MDVKHDERRDLIISLLETHGYPKMEPEVVIDLLPEIWKELDKNELVPEGMKYDEFYIIAFENYMYHKLMNEMGL